MENGTCKMENGGRGMREKCYGVRRGLRMVGGSDREFGALGQSLPQEFDAVFEFPELAV
jgi:hypothetical protein